MASKFQLPALYQQSNQPELNQLSIPSAPEPHESLDATEVRVKYHEKERLELENQKYPELNS